ncbi:NADH-quinone oxidoreductase subunit NuoH [Reichenbachiella carrageenanivorans]|uniref:NADH-quinone oxidoreductase subunit H n=1 Tax=Reichenbachiella carrageenanivorans TaxID=2979869 RepID=A0ABY6D6T8_9BACT|nr:NADH-quinone oxidoreductase subunit NuoH [Reichenbachiella carrageenanivorans]UXX79550.1 NADH-quinone oxidoreductase subunit NuoH [Reichenbachiella carrageenanivorans]
MIAFLFYLPFLLFFLLIAVYAERKVSAFIQDRLGPMVVGKYGILQVLADGLKMLQKEDIITKSADKPLFVLAPLVIFLAIFSGFAVLPLTSDIEGSGVETGVYFLMAVVSLDVIGILMAGWGSNSKFSLFGALRAVAQIVSYEIPLGLSILCVVMLTQTLNLQEMSVQQGLLDPENTYGGFLAWNVFKYPMLWVVFIIFFIASLAESNRTPFDLPESESELIGGFHTEYSGFRWGIIMLGEYGMMLLVSLVASVLFFGSWNTPLPNIGAVKLADWTSGTHGTLWADFIGIFWLISKAMVLVFVQMWVRWTYPRVRVDQMMSLSWKYLTPIALVMVFVCGIWKLWIG